MRLSRIKLAGFKSFVDPTTMHFPSNLLGVVGPNGCGKSNVIDAVRWVLGESSAKHLRGDSMADVIFNGSSARKPVGTASIELVFDNSDGAISGQFANYNEVAIKRVVSRDGLSSYYLNNTKCRRKDIRHIFLGTGLGPRSYAIIEQGMISRLIEAKPEEMRFYIEEAAGVSKFKDRRHETENRMRHTRDNLDRLNDLREEVEKHLRHLNRQAAAARRYKKLKAAERKQSAELLALKLRELEDKSKAEERLVRERETELEAAIAKQRAAETRIEKAREDHSAKNEAFNAVQASYYKEGAEIARLEQAIQHGRELRQRQEGDREEASSGLQEIVGHIERDEAELANLARSLEEMLPRLETARRTEHESSENLKQAEQAMQHWREGWEAFNARAGEAQQVTHVEQARIERLESELQRVELRRRRVQQELESLSIEKLTQEIEPLVVQQAGESEALAQNEAHLARCLDEIGIARSREQALSEELDEHRREMQELAGKLASLEALQRASSGRASQVTNDWLQARGLAQRPRLVETLEVDRQWRVAVETVLGQTLDAVCVEGVEAYARALGELGDSTLTLLADERAGPLTSDRLDQFVRGPRAVLERLAAVQVAASLDKALKLRNGLAQGESVITPDGTWIGRDWITIDRGAEKQDGALRREDEIRQIKAQIRELRDLLDQKEQELEQTRTGVAQLESRRETRQREVNQCHQQRADLTASLDARRSLLQQQESRRLELDDEAVEAEGFVGETEKQLDAARRRLAAATAQLNELEGERRRLESQRDELGARLDKVRDRAIADRSSAQELALQVESRRSTHASMLAGLERMRNQLINLQTRVADLEVQLSEGELPLEKNQRLLSERLESSVQVKEALAAARAQVEKIDEQLRHLDQERLKTVQEVQDIRASLDEVRLTAREVKVRRETLLEQFETTGFDLETIVAELDEGATIEAWSEQLETLTAKLSRLGPINLAAIDEFKEESERKEYLDAQHADLTEALTTLQNAIRRIDRETKARFKDTFEKVNLGFKELFPRLFGGGRAYLDLMGDDLLSAGITVMARPPGKRNSTIHLLSGGEKALTAVALVFAIFQLNPSPFCMLDEVDAPLDDVNVQRYCDIVREMSKEVQFILITHNKITMELADQLVGITMAEPGVSRLVAVDVDEAVQMAAV